MEGKTPQRAPIQIQADIFRHRDVCARLPAGVLFTAMPYDAGPALNDAEPQPRHPWHEDDLRRAMAVAEEAGLTSYRVEIAPDGTISIIVGEDAEAGEDPKSGGA